MVIDDTDPFWRPAMSTLEVRSGAVRSLDDRFHADDRALGAAPHGATCSSFTSLSDLDEL
jgi:hypothetical protein